MLLKYFIRIGLNSLVKLLEKSLSDDSKAKPITNILLFLVKRLTEVLTDDDLDNTVQIEQLMLIEFPEHIKALNESYANLKENN